MELERESSGLGGAILSRGLLDGWYGELNISGLTSINKN